MTLTCRNIPIHFAITILYNKKIREIKNKKVDKYGGNWTFKRGRNSIYPAIYPTKHPFIFLQAERRRRYHLMITGGAFLLG